MGSLKHFKTSKSIRQANSYGDCASCNGLIQQGRPCWLVKGKWYHHHCAAHLSTPPAGTVCEMRGCTNSTSVEYKDGRYEVKSFCWLHRRGTAVQRGLGLAGDLQRRAEAVKQAEAAEQAWMASRPDLFPEGVDTA